MELNWIAFKDKKPENQKKVYVVIENENGKHFQSMAIFIEKRKVLAEDFMEDYDEETSDYDEENDEYWTKEGFYECAYTSETWYRIPDKVIKWHPLFDLSNCA
jgi:hypothetical protein